METYLEALSSEFIASYKGLSDRQRNYEERVKILLERFAKDELQAEPGELPGFVWDSVLGLPRLNEFLHGSESYRERFERPLDDASELLRDELARVLRASMAAF
jgi:hypothetical protein